MRKLGGKVAVFLKKYVNPLIEEIMLKEAMTI
jgi:hypothetical protein